jgi:putative proteasome-type protease
MTYGVGMLLDAGIVMISDSRTNAGVDNIATFHKLSIFQNPGERAIALIAAGNLSITQSVVGLLKEQLHDPDRKNLLNAATMLEAARCVGDAIREIHDRDGKALEEFKIEFNVSMILGGQIKGDAPRLFNIYSAGNFIEANSDTCYFQIGETKYGKPIIDRVITRKTRLERAAKCGLISMDSTIRSNLTVSPPLDVVVLRTGELRVSSHQVIEAENPYFLHIRARWSEMLGQAFLDLPDPDWIKKSD